MEIKKPANKLPQSRRYDMPKLKLQLASQSPIPHSAAQTITPTNLINNSQKITVSPKVPVSPSDININSVKYRLMHSPYLSKSRKSIRARRRSIPEKSNVNKSLTIEKNSNDASTPNEKSHRRGSDISIEYIHNLSMKIKPYNRNNDFPYTFRNDAPGPGTYENPLQLSNLGNLSSRECSKLQLSQNFKPSRRFLNAEIVLGSFVKNPGPGTYTQHSMFEMVEKKVFKFGRHGEESIRTLKRPIESKAPRFGTPGDEAFLKLKKRNVELSPPNTYNIPALFNIPNLKILKKTEVPNNSIIEDSILEDQKNDIQEPPVQRHTTLENTEIQNTNENLITNTKNDNENTKSIIEENKSSIIDSQQNTPLKISIREPPSTEKHTIIQEIHEEPLDLFIFICIMFSIALFVFFCDYEIKIVSGNSIFGAGIYGGV